MTCPFPGMDVYVEDPARWPDFHSTFIHCWREAIEEQLPKEYEANIAEQVFLVDEERPAQAGPDLTVSRRSNASRSRKSTGGTATLEPVTIPVVLLNEPKQPYIELVHGRNRKVIAVLELLSSANKENPGRRAYLTKRNALLYQPVHLVELDLLIKGRRLPLEQPLPRGDDYYLLLRATKRPDCEVYAWSIREPLPRVPLPLKAPDADVFVDLQGVLATAYRRVRLERKLDYKQEPSKRLDKAARAWVQERITASTRTT